MYRLFRPLLFRLDAETAHGGGMRAASWGERLPTAVRALYAPRLGAAAGRLEQTLWGHRFRTPLGLAAGFDKNAERLRFWHTLGFGFAEIGSVTARPGAGNPRPRAFSLPADGALVNRLGLGNEGAEAVAARLARQPQRPGFPRVVNIAKTHSPAILGADGVADFQTSVRALAPHADVLVLNVSCPNTAEGKTFETPDALDALLAAVVATLGKNEGRETRNNATHSTAPPTAGQGASPSAPQSQLPSPQSRERSEPSLLVKLSPPPSAGVDAGAVDELVQIALGYGVAGFVASNTASDRDGLATPRGEIDRIGNGGLSGRPVAKRAAALVRHLYRTTDGTVPIVGVGGIDSADEAYARIRAGASLVELYTGLVYQGPGLVRAITEGLVRRLDRDRLGHIGEAIGLDA